MEKAFRIVRLDKRKSRWHLKDVPCLDSNIKHFRDTLYLMIPPFFFYSVGLVPTLIQIFPHAGLQFGFYTFFKTLWEVIFSSKVH